MTKLIVSYKTEELTLERMLCGNITGETFYFYNDDEIHDNMMLEIVREMENELELKGIDYTTEIIDQY